MIRFAITFKQAFAQISRNKTMTATSLFSITAILLVLGIFFIIIVNVSNMAEGIKQDFDQVQVYLLDDVTEEGAIALMQRIDAVPGVESTAYLTREDALEQWKVKWGDNAYLLDRLATNPLSNSIIIKISDLSLATALVNEVGTFEGIEEINYSQNTVDRLLSVTSVIQIVSLVIILFLIFISIMVVSNTIKLTVLAREKEITIMRYVGATNWFIRGPFLLEGMILGAISAAISSALVGVIYYYLTERFGVDFILYVSTGFVPLGFLMENLLIIFLALGISIGACGSLISMHRFLER
ncbi:MAG: permease-like cell division protein FtsX [Clostridiales Family XIII bacterium]|jgi:cell division transport system permease protein|nr:permease-like cell division protein FtsX [Clostridiales Family XIII bacterium]